MTYSETTKLIAQNEHEETGNERDVNHSPWHKYFLEVSNTSVAATAVKVILQ